MKKFVLCLFVMLLFVLPAGAELIFNEVMASNGVYRDGEAHDWVEIYNAGKTRVDLSGCYLSDSKKDLQKWAFPEGTTVKGGEYVLVYCTGEEMNPGRNGTYYANFKISASGDQLFLTDKDGQTLLAQMQFDDQYGNVSWGKAEEGEAYGFFAVATPGKKNEKTACDGQMKQPVLEGSGGFYDAPVLAKATGQAGATLRYTLNGETPTEKDKQFPAEGLLIDQTTILRVAAFGEGQVPSQPVTASYFIGEAQPVAVVSLVTDEKYLFDQKTGALVRGSGSGTANYYQNWEYPTNVEFFNADGECEINQMATFAVSGHSSRQNAQKSLAIYARKAYGEDRFYFNPFPNRDYDSYKSLLLRSTNSDAGSTRLRDVVFTSLAEPFDILYQDALIIEVYINGRYWGHYNLREKINKHFIAQWEGVKNENAIDNIDILTRTGEDEFVQNGDNEDWLALCDFCKKADLNDPENLQYVLDRLDVDNAFTYAIFQIIIGNADITNVRMYRVPGGKWKYVLYDVEGGFLSLDKAPMNYHLKKPTDKIQGFRHEPLAALLEVPEMRDKFLRRFAEMLETSFLWPNVEQTFAKWEAALEILLPRHIDRWPYLTVKQWRQDVNAVKYYARVRPARIVSQLQKHMKLTDAEVEFYFGDVQRQLEELNIIKN